MTYLTKITTPFGLLSEGFQDMLREQKGVTIQFYNLRGEWEDIDQPFWSPHLTYRVKPEPREFWLARPFGGLDYSVLEVEPQSCYWSEVIHVREVV
jgi:hypothetical protein